MSSDQGVESSYQYNGLGDRLSQNGVNYTLDLNNGLPQILSDGTNTYTYGVGRISQTNTATEYFLGDALGSVRQLTDSAGAVTYAASYSPYGVVTQTSGDGQSAYGFTGEQQSGDLVYLRARYYNPADGRFLSRDTWRGSYNNPLSLNRWNYVEGNPIVYTDPSGHISIYCEVNGFNSRNLTDWLVREMTVQSNDWPVWPGIGTVVTTSNWLLDSAAHQIARVAWDKVSKDSDVTEEGKAWIAGELAVAGGTRVIGSVDENLLS